MIVFVCFPICLSVLSVNVRVCMCVCPSTAMLVRPRGFLMWNSMSGKQHMLVTVASTTISPAKPWSKRQGKLHWAVPLPNTVCGMLRCSSTVILLYTRILRCAQAIWERCGNT